LIHSVYSKDDNGTIAHFDIILLTQYLEIHFMSSLN